jgi:hypothetical protein
MLDTIKIYLKLTPESKDVLMVTMFKAMFLTLSLFLFFSCGNQGEAEDQGPQGNPNNYTWTQPMKTPTSYGEEEMEIATGVCQALQKKRAFVSAQGSLEMDFKVTQRDCGVQTNTERRATGIMRATRSGELQLTNTTRGVSLFGDVISDRHPKVKDFCELVLRGEAPNNTQRDGTELRYQVNFFRQASYDWIQIAEFRRRGSTFYPYLIERVSVVTPTINSSANLQGFVKVRGVNTPCADNVNTKVVLQEWL